VLPPPASQTWPDALVAQGKDLYVQRCARCHGFEARSANILPDLRRSPALADPALWKTIVEDGTLAANGMIAWKAFLPEGGAEAIRGFVAGQARAAAQ
jgi:quinohemoprotein ethanol dehydrogenase